MIRPSTFKSWSLSWLLFYPYYYHYGDPPSRVQQPIVSGGFSCKCFKFYAKLGILVDAPPSCATLCEVSMNSWIVSHMDMDIRIWRSLRCCRIWSALEVRFSNFKVRKMCAICVQGVHKMCPRCAKDVCKMCARLCARCVQGVRKMCARCVQDV